jgi:hypothetical protein
VTHLTTIAALLVVAIIASAHAEQVIHCTTTSSGSRTYFDGGGHTLSHEWTVGGRVYGESAGARWESEPGGATHVRRK